VTDKLLLDEPGANVARLTIDNPERRGALDHELLDALGEYTRTLDARCLVIRGSGPTPSTRPSRHSTPTRIR
jgi:enoyl-CoA hydratase/carnithine racemase